MQKTILAALAALLLATAGAAVADNQAQGTILLSSPGTDFTGGVTQNLYTNFGLEFNGLDGWIINLDTGLSEFSLTGDAGVVGICDLDIYFFDANGGALTSYTNTPLTESCDEGGEIPSGSAVAIANLYLGFNVNFEFLAE